MRGLEGATATLANFLEARVPAKVDELVARLGVPSNADEEDALYPPALYAAEARRLEADEYPAMMVDPVATTAVRHVDTGTDGLDTFLVRYRLRLYVMVRGTTYEEVAHRRARLVLAARELVLSRRSLDDVDARYVEGSLVESYSDVDTDEAGRSYAGAYVELELELTEVLDGSPDQPAYPVTSVTVSTAPHHPALD